MPNWKDIANKIELGMFGDDWRKADAEKQSLAAGKQRMDLAASAEGRAADEFEFSKGKRGKEMAQLDNLVKAGLLSNEDRQNVLDTFKAKGGASGEAQRTDEDRLLKQRSAGRADEELQIHKDSSARQGAEAIRNAETHKLQMDAGQRANRIGAATEEETIDKSLGAGDVMVLNDLQQRYVAASRNDPEAAARIEDEYNLVLGEMRKKKAIRGVNKRVTSGAKY